MLSLAEQGFERIVVWRGCGGHDLRDAVREFNQASPHKAQAFLPEHPFHEIWCRLGEPDVPGGHADSFSTSISLHLRPATVRVNEIRDPAHRPVDWQDPNLDFARYSSTGVIGNPTHVSAQLGAKLWEASVASVAKTLRNIALEANPARDS